MGRIVGLFGLRGEVKIAASRIGEDALAPGLAVQLRFEDARAELASQVTHLRRAKGTFVASLAGVDGADAAEQLVGALLIVPRAEIALGEREYFDDDLIGCRLFEGERAVGTVRAVRHYPAQDMLELEGGALVPLVAQFVREVDLGARVLRVELPAGLVEGEPESG